MKSSSIHKVLHTKGIEGARAYRDALIHDWKLKPEIQDQLLIHKLCYGWWNEIFTHLNDGELIIQGRSYSITWINSPAEIRRRGGWIELSMRYCFMLERGYVLVRCAEGTPTFRNEERIEWS